MRLVNFALFANSRTMSEKESFLVINLVVVQQFCKTIKFNRETDEC